MSYTHPYHEWSSEAEVGKTIAALIKLTGATRVMEVGVWHGVTSGFILDAMPKGSQFVAIDIEDHRQPESMQQFIAANQRGVVAQFIEESSLTAPARFNEFDIIFVDTMHHWAHIWPEFKVVYPALRKGGLLIYHDSHHMADVKKLMGVISERYRMNKIDLLTPDNRGLTILQK